MKSININGKLLELDTPKVMAIVNVTPDSFYSGSRVQSEEQIARRIEEVVTQGCDIIDIGGYSTRPNAEVVELQEEIERVAKGFEIVRRVAGDFPISVDSFRSEVVEKIYSDFGAFVVNDVSGGGLDENMFELCGKLQLPYILGHMRGTPETMTKLNQYDDMLGDILEFYVARVGKLRANGVIDIILDPCFGFSKNIEQNFYLLKNLYYFKVIDLPILAGLSRKSMIYKTLDIEPSDSLNGTSVLNWQALINGASMLRVHDVKEAVEVVKLYQRYVTAQ